MKENLRNLLELFCGIGFSLFFSWKINMSSSSSLKNDSNYITVFFAGLFVFYLTIHVFKIFFKYIKISEGISLGTITGASFVMLELLILFFSKTREQIFDLFGYVLLLWLFTRLGFWVMYKVLQKRYK